MDGGSRSAFTDTPLAWLGQLIADHLDTNSRLAFFRTCKAFRRMVLASSKHVQCKVAMSMKANAIARSLQLLTDCKNGSDVQLELQAEVLQSDSSSCFHGGAFLFWDGIIFRLPRPQLTSVTSVNVEGVLSGHLVPPPLCEYCPNMRCFKRTGIFGHQLDPRETPVPCPQLQELILVNPGLSEDHNRWSLGCMQQQLRSLPNLHSFRCVFDDHVYQDDEDEVLPVQWTDWMLHSVSCLNLQLKRLHVDFLFVPFEPAMWSDPWPQLQMLYLPMLEITTADVKLLLHQAPQLQELAVRCASLDGSLGAYACTWKRLSFLIVMHVRALVQLPFKGLEQLIFGSIEISAEDLPFLPTAVHMLSKVTEVRTMEEQKLDLHIACPDNAGVMAVAPLLQLLPRAHLSLTGPRKAMGPNWLNAISHMHFSRLSLSPRMLADDVCLLAVAQQCSSLQHLCLELQEHEGVMSARRLLQLSNQLSMLCVAAPGPLVLDLHASVTSQLGVRWRNQAVLGMQLAGHTRVTFQWEDPVSNNEVGSVGTTDDEALDVADDDGDDDDDDDGMPPVDVLGHAPFMPMPGAPVHGHALHALVLQHLHAPLPLPFIPAHVQLVNAAPMHVGAPPPDLDVWPHA